MNGIFFWSDFKFSDRSSHFYLNFSFVFSKDIASQNWKGFTTSVLVRWFNDSLSNNPTIVSSQFVVVVLWQNGISWPIVLVVLEESCSQKYDQLLKYFHFLFISVRLVSNLIKNFRFKFSFSDKLIISDQKNIEKQIFLTILCYFKSLIQNHFEELIELKMYYLLNFEKIFSIYKSNFE